ncbi:MULTISPECIES: protein kinase domain-containing protein [unclassified Coleofasciculus]|uniref:protein kinase domain-containing protein n=1 Tax=unclassified Coleofasciculus TaxID=2692782 RepID=UPI00187E381D|nr:MULTISPECIES: type IV pilin-like G/H family protein [unclassified Coleofasciculus]MBE9127438.1 protein kinase [Coleofasciculus sp. LEGE 07081]MBE9149236.1 protein kinase [Coleofasciculus sp. LEGE 07092]
MLKAKDTLKERYQLIRQLGQNAGRQTWLATDIESSPPKTVIVKLLAFNPQMQWDDLKLFEREAQVLKNINHPKIPEYLDYFSVDDVGAGLQTSSLGCQDIGKAALTGLPWFCLVQEYIPGDSLKQLLEQGKPFTEQQVRYFAEDILKILSYLHELSPPILHRDIKPSNLILAKNNQIYLVDFGAVQDRAKAEGVTFTVVGTSGYAPPEQLWGKAVAASDLYALGATLIHLLTGISPANLPQRRMRIQFKDRVSINPDFAKWIEQLIQPAPEKRFSTARQALSALQAPLLPRPNRHSISGNSYSPQTNRGYGCGCLALIVFVVAPPLVLMATSFLDKERDRGAVGEMNRYQAAYFIEDNTFNDDFGEVKRAVEGEYGSLPSERYNYIMRVTDGAVFHYALSRKEKLKSYVGGIFAVPSMEVGINDTSNSMTTLSILCVAEFPGLVKPTEPTYSNGKLACGEGTRHSGG